MNSSAPNSAVLEPVAIVRYSGSPRPKLKNAMLVTKNMNKNYRAMESEVVVMVVTYNMM